MSQPNALWSAPFVRYDNFFSNRPDATPADLHTLLTTHPEPICDAASCAGKECQFKKSRGSWSPVSLKEGTTRGNANVVSVNYFVADLDYMTEERLEAVIASIEGYAAIVYSTHNHAPPSEGSYRLVMPMSRPVLPGEWAAVRRGIVEAFSLPIDPQTKDLSRIYALPDSRAGGAASETASFDGKPISVEEALEVAAQVSGAPAAATPVSVSLPPMPESYDLGDLRARLSEVRRSKASGDDRAKGHAELLGRVLDGKPAAKTGERDATLLKICGLLAYWLPAGVPFEPVLELMRPSMLAMDTEPEGFGHWVEEVRDMYARQAASRAAADAKRTEENERFASALRQVAGKPLRAAVDLAEGWEVLLIEGKGGPKACEHNVDLVLACDPELRDTLRWNEVTKKIEVRGGPFAGMAVSSLDGKVAGWLQSEKQLMAGELLVGRSLLRVARDNAYDPIAEFLGEVAWDGVPRLDTFFERYLGAEPTPYVRAVSRRWLISLVARGLRPGCKVDTVLILEGPQGAFKSSALELLVGSAWFLDTQLRLGDKDTMQAIAGAWLVELGELASLKGAESDRVKQFVTSKVDKFRPPFGRVTEESPRRCVLVGTCNPGVGGYLTDQTGNRRFWPVRVGLVDLEAIERDRDKILAEAVAAFRAGERWHLNTAEAAVAASEADERLVESTALEAIERWWYGEPPAKRPERFGIIDAAEMALRLTPDRIDHKLRIEIGHALRRLGFERRGAQRNYYATEALLREPQRTTAARAATLAAVAPLKAKAGGNG